MDAPIHPAPGALVGSSDTAVAFTGTQYVVVPNNAAYNVQGSFTIEGWISPAAEPAGLLCPLSYAQGGDPRNGWFLYQNNVAGAGWDFRMFKNSHLDRALDISGGEVAEMTIQVNYVAAPNTEVISKAVTLDNVIIPAIIRASREPVASTAAQVGAPKP